MRILSDFFDKIYCINLKERTDRWEECLNNFEYYQIESYERIDAVKILKDDLEYLDQKSKSQLGCALSFYRIIQNAYYNEYKSILIFEDDFYFIHSKNKTQEILKKSIENLPEEWDVFYLGANIIYDYCNNPMVFFKKELFKINSAYCMHSIAFSKKGVNNFINEFPNEDSFIKKILEEYKAIDVFMAKKFCFQNLCFIPNEMLCNQYASFSSIENTYCNYRQELIKRFENSKNNL